MSLGRYMKRGNNMTKPLIRKETQFDEDEYALISEAANFRGLNVAAFLRTIALEMARQTISDKKRFSLSNRDWDQLMFDLENPPEPNEKLINLMKKE